MRPLATKFTRDGYTHLQLDRTQHAAIYRIVESGGLEVIKIGHAKAQTRTMDGKTVTFEARETYPTSERFGMSAWYFMRGDDQNAWNAYAQHKDRPSHKPTKS